MPVIGPSASVPYGLSSSYLLSPYPTLPLPGYTSSDQQSSTAQQAFTTNTNPNIPGSPVEGQDLTTYQLSLSLDQVRFYSSTTRISSVTGNNYKHLNDKKLNCAFKADNIFSFSYCPAFRELLKRKISKQLYSAKLIAKFCSTINI